MATPIEGHQPPTTFHLGVATSSVTSLPEVTTAMGTPFHDETEPVATTRRGAFTDTRLPSAFAAEADEATFPPKYSGLITAASEADIPLTVNAGNGAVVGATTTAVVAGAATTFLGGDEHPLNATAAARSVESPMEKAQRDEDRET